MNAVTKTISTLLQTEAVKATKFISEKEIVRATRRTYNGKFNRRSNVEMSLTLGRPNFAERKFIKLCKKAGEKFPVQKVQLKFAKKK